MDAFLSDLSQDGEQVSQGVFTMDISKAQLKLAKYQLAHFDQFVGFLISTLASSPATHLFVENVAGKFFSSGSTTLTFVDWSLTADDIRAIGISSLGGSERRDLKYLAILLSALASKHPLVLRSHHLDECIALRVSPEDVEVLNPEELSEIEGRSDSYVSLEVGADLSKILATNFSQLARWSPKSIELSENWYARGFNATSTLKGGLSFLHQPGPGEVPVINPWPERTRTIEFGEPDSYPKFLALTVDESEEKNFGLTILVDGMAYRAPVGLPRVCGYIVANDLKRDLSYQNIVQNQAYSSVLEEIRRSAAQMLADLVDQDVTLEAQQILKIAELVSELQEDLDLSEVEKSLFEKSGELTIATHPDSLEVLLARLKNSPDIDASDLFAQYRRRIAGTRRNGHLDETSRLVRASGRCRSVLGQSTKLESDLRALLQILTGKACEFHLCEEPLATYLGSILAWRDDDSKRPDWEKSSAHPTWFLPMELYARWDLPGELEIPEAMTAKFPAWLKLMEHLRANRGERAMEMVETLDELQFDSHRQAWNELFWTFYRGRVSWKTQIRLRVELTKSYMKDPERSEVDAVSRFIQSTGANYLERSEKAFEASANYLSTKSYFGGDFWPEFFTVILQGKRQYPKAVRVAWTKLIAQSLLGSLINSDTGVLPLSEAWEFPLSRDSNSL